MLNFTGFWSDTKKRHMPLLNQYPITSSSSAVGISTVYAQKQKFWKWFKSRPELNSPVQIRVDDTISEVEFFDVDGSVLGRNKRLRAEKFWNDNMMYEILKTLQYDRLVTGSGFLWVGKIDVNEDSIKTVSSAINRSIRIKDVTPTIQNEVFNRTLLKAIDEDLRSLRKVDVIPSSTVIIQHNKYDITSYVQYFGGYNQEFFPNEVIHIPLMRLDGKVDGFSPVESLAYELILLWAIKENMLSYIRNGGSPSKIFILPEELANSENHQWLTAQLTEQGVLENRHGNMVLTGKVEVNDLEPNIKDMEYEKLALYITSNIAYALRVPVSRIPYLIGSAQSKSDAGGLAESGYWSMIESDQNGVEMFLNSQLCNKIGFSFKFIRKYKIDDLREAQAMNFMVDAVTKIDSVLKGNKLKLVPSKLRELLKLSANEVTDLPIEEQMPQLSGLGTNRSFMPDKQVNRNPDQIEKDSTKRRGADNNPKGSLQTGF